ncbi:MFS transporter [Sphingomonas sp. FW199]|uniref:MFS transporter n=1 Tax=Sphingomonas sp. FW199 TaxID=3400217 RepID=UPI003CF62C4E
MSMAPSRDRTRVLIACTLGNAVSTTPAVHAVFGLFLLPLSAEFQWPRAAVSVVLGIMALTGAIVYPLAGRYADDHGARQMVIPALVLFAAAVAALSMLTGSLLHLYGAFFLVSLFGSIASTPIYSKVIAEWYDKGRGTALGISAGLGNGAGSVLFPIVAAIVVASEGWRAGYLAMGALILSIGLPAIWFLLRDAPVAEPRVAGPDGPVAGATLADAMRMPAFWIIMVAIASGAGCTTAIFSHVVPILADRGYGMEVGTAVVSTFALTTSAWQIATGRLLDLVQNPRVVIPMVAMAILGLALLQYGDGTAILVVAGIALGIGMGTQYGALPYYLSRYFGTRAFGSIIGVMYSAVIAAQGITPVLIDHAFDVQGSYQLAVVLACCALLAGAALLLLLPRYPVGDALPEPRLAGLPA